MTTVSDEFDNFMQHSTALHSAGLARVGKPYKLHSHQVLTSIFFALIDRLGVTSSIEVGAFQAEFSRRFKRDGDNRTALAIEANPYTVDVFRAAIEAEGILYHHAAILDVDGPCELQVSNTAQDQASGFIRGNNSLRTAAGRTETKAVSVPGRTLDSLVADYVDANAFPDPATTSPALWIDAEGALDLVIKGGQQTIRNSVALFTEVEAEALWDEQSDFRQIHNQLRATGFFPFLRDCEYEPDQYNVIFLNSQLEGGPLLVQLQAEFESGLARVP